MRKLKLFILFLVPILLITGCSTGEQAKLDKAINKTSITKKGLASYRCKVSLNNKEDNLTYVILNSENKNYTVNITKGQDSYAYEIKDGMFIGKASDVVSMNSSYHDTDKFLDGLKNISDVKTSKKKIDKTEYTKYSFKISKAFFNKLLSSFDVKVKKDGKGYAYVDKNNHIYIINYESGDIQLNIAYTDYSDVK